MSLKEILAKLKVNESGQLDESIEKEIEDYINEVVDLKAEDKAKLMVQEIAQPIIDESKNELAEEYEEKFEEYKEMISSKFSDFVDSILDEEVEISDDIKEFARKGQLYSDLIDQFKIRIGIDEGILDEEAKSLLKEAREEIISLSNSVNELENEKLDLKSDARQMAADLYIQEKCSGLTENQKKRASVLLEGIQTKQQIDKKFNLISEAIFGEKTEETTNKSQVDEKHCVCPKCGRETSITEGSCELYNCPDCEDTKLVEKKDCKETETDKNKDNVQETTGFANLINQYATVLESKKF